MRQLTEINSFNELCNELEESEQVVNSNDFGGHWNLDDKNPYSGLTYLEQGMAELVGEVVAMGFAVAKAEKEVEKTVKELVDAGALPEPPTEESSTGAKAMFISMAKPKVKAQLQLKELVL